MIRTFKVGDSVTTSGETWPSLAGQRGIVINVWLTRGRIDHWQDITSRSYADGGKRYDVQFPDVGRIELGLKPSALLPID